MNGGYLVTKGKNTNSLMRHLRDKHNINIQGSKHKRELLNMGYYHGYKGYRYMRSPQNKINFNHFNEISAIYKFDMTLKTLFYPNLMLLETALKNYTLEVIIESGSADFEYVFTHLLNDYKSENTGNSKYKKKLKNRLNLRDHIYNTITYNYSGGKPVIQHFFHKNEPVPIWAIFEVINLGNFGSFIQCLNKDTRLKIAEKIGIHTTAHNHNGRIVETIIFLMKDIRNAVAHNSAIFDCRFKGSNPSADLKAFLTSETSINNITFDSIVDYLILVVFLSKKVGTNKTELKQLINSFYRKTEHFREVTPTSVYTSILGTDLRNKIKKLLAYV